MHAQSHGSSDQLINFWASHFLPDCGCRAQKTTSGGSITLAALHHNACTEPRPLAGEGLFTTLHHACIYESAACKCSPQHGCCRLLFGVAAGAQQLRQQGNGAFFPYLPHNKDLPFCLLRDCTCALVALLLRIAYLRQVPAVRG